MATTAHLLLSFKESIVSGGSIIQGFLCVLESDQKTYKKGTIVLIDQKANDMIPCLVDRLNDEIFRIEVEIKKWTYIYDEANGYQHLEFCLDDVFKKGSELSVLRSGIVNDLKIIQAALQAKTPFYTPTPGTTHVQSKMNVAGIVVAVSPLYTPLQSKARFFVEIANGSEDTAITLYFCGDDLIKYQSYFRIEQYYTFTDFSPVTISYGRNTRSVLSFSPTSTLQIITPSIYQQLNFEQDFPVDGAKYPLTVSKISTERSTYTGYITRVVDSVLGIYELDDKYLLSVFHHFVSAQPFRENTKIRITHFHKTCIYTDNSNYTSILLDNLWEMKGKQMEGGRYEVLVACNRTRIEIVSFPVGYRITTNDLPRLRDTREALAIYMMTHHSTFSQFMRLLEIYATLVIRFKLVSLSTDEFENIVESISKHIFKATNTPSTRGHGNLGNDFFQHDLACSAIGSKCTVDDRGYLSVYLDAYPCIDQCMEYLHERKTDYEMDLAGANFAFDPSTIKVQSARFDPTDGYYILGMIDQDNGRLVLKDNSSSVLLSVGWGGNVQLGDLYLLRCGQYFYEDLSYRKDFTNYDLSSTYLSCHSSDLLKVFAKSTDEDIKFQIQQKIEHNRPTSFNISSNSEKLFANLHQYFVAHVLKKFPITTSFSNTNTTLECRVVVRLYTLGSINHRNFIHVDPSKSYDLILSTESKSLGFLNQLHLDDYCVIHGLNQRKCFIETRGSKIFFMDASHKIYPITFGGESIKNAVILTPAYGTRSIDKTFPRPVINISEIDDPYRERIVSKEHEYVNVRGVVILKKFDQRIGVGVRDTLAHDLFELGGIGTGVPHRKLQIQLRELDQLQMIRIYVNLTNVQYPLGLVHGSTVVFRNLKRRTKRNGAVYFSAGSETSIEVESTTATPKVYTLQNDQTEADTLSWVLQMQHNDNSIEDRLLRIHCNVSTVMTLQLNWKCSNCGFVLKNTECYAVCQNASRIFKASAYIEISDGTSSANANVDGERLVFRLLRLSDSQITVLKNYLTYEEIDYSIWNPSSLYQVDADKMKKMCGFTVDDLLTRVRAVSKIWMFGKVKPASKKRKFTELKQDQGSKESIVRPITISDNGGLLRTFEYIKPKIDIQDIEPSDPITYAYSLLNT